MSWLNELVTYVALTVYLCNNSKQQLLRAPCDCSSSSTPAKSITRLMSNKKHPCATARNGLR